MTVKIAMTALALTVLPVVSYASCSGRGHDTTMSCAPGMTYDGNSNSCVKIVNS
jgi:hypothetical protein